MGKPGKKRFKAGAKVLPIPMADVFRPEDPITLHKLSLIMRLNIDQVFSGIFSTHKNYVANQSVVSALYRENIKGSATDINTQRAELLKKALVWDTQTAIFKKKPQLEQEFLRRTQFVTKHTSNEWVIPHDVTVILPMPTSFDRSNVLPAFESREAKIPVERIAAKKVRNDFELDDRWDRINDHVRKIRKRCNGLRNALLAVTKICAENRKQVHLLQQCHTMLEFMLKNTTHASAAIKADLKRESQNVRDLKYLTGKCLEEARRFMLENPEDNYLSELGLHLEDGPTRQAEKLRDLLRVTTFEIDVEKAVEAMEFAGAVEWQELVEMIAWASRLLLLSPLSDTFFKQEIEPTLKAWEKRYKELPGEKLEARDPKLTQELSAGRSVFKSQFPQGSVLKSVFTTVNDVKSVAGTGLSLSLPAVRTVSFLRFAAVHVMQLAGKSIRQGFGSNYRVMCATMDDLTLKDRFSLIFMAEEQDLDPKFRSIGWKTKVGFSHMGGTALAVLGVYVAYTSMDENKPFESYAALLASAGGTGEAVGRAMLVMPRFADDVAIKAGTKAAARFAAVVGIVSGSIATHNAIQDKDEAGAILAGMGVVGSAATLGGTIMAAGLATAEVPPLGAFLLVVGAVLTVASIALGLIKALVMKGTWTMFDLYTKAFPGKPRKIGQITIKPLVLTDEKLERAYDNMRSRFGKFFASNDVEWWELDATDGDFGLKQLEAEGFTPKEIQTITFNSINKDSLYMPGEDAWLWFPRDRLGANAKRNVVHVLERVPDKRFLSFGAGRWTYRVKFEGGSEPVLVEEHELEAKFPDKTKVHGFFHDVGDGESVKNGEGSWFTATILDTEPLIKKPNEPTYVKVRWSGDSGPRKLLYPMKMIVPKTDFDETNLEEGDEVWAWFRPPNDPNFGGVSAEGWTGATIKSIDKDLTPWKVTVVNPKTFKDGKVFPVETFVVHGRGSKRW